MRILIDGSTLCDANGGTGAGIEHYTWQITYWLLRIGSGHEFVISVPPQLNQIRLRELIGKKHHVSVIRSLGPRVSFLTRHFFLPFRFWLHRPDIVFAPSGQLPLVWRGPSVITIHDLAIYDHPEWFPAGQDFSVKTIVPRSIDRATEIITVSEATTRRLLNHFSNAEGRTHVVYEGVEPPQEILDSLHVQDTRFPFDRDYVFYLGTIEPRKNLVNAIRAFDAFLHSHPEQADRVRFILAGKRGWKTKEVEDEFALVNRSWKHSESKGVIQFLGPVTEQEKWSLLSRAACLLFPSYDEGFGLPVLEAMSVGTPVITTPMGAIPEVSGDAALYVDPEDVEHMSLSIAQCLLVPEGIKTFCLDGYTRAAEFTWERSARETLRVLLQAAEKGPVPK